MTKIYVTDCSTLMDVNILTSALIHLKPARLNKINSLKTPECKAQTAAAGLLLHHCFGPNHSIKAAKYGKLYLEDRTAYFSISHSDQWVALAVAEQEIGFDLQVLSPIRPLVLHRYFNENEQIYIGDDDTRFTEIWTQHEAYTKYLGAPITTAHVPDRSLPHCSGRYQNAIYTLYGDDKLEIFPVNIKDLL